MAIVALKETSLQIPVSTIFRPHVVADGGSCRYFDPLDGIHDQQPQASVEIIEAGECLQARTGLETVLRIFRELEWAHVRCEAEEADGFEEVVCLAFVLNAESALFEQGQLFRNIDGWLAERLHAEKLPGIKNPLNLCVAAEATIGMAGVLLETLCDA
ncbi:hypothetical protein D3C78_1489290 [compost metagenome]